MKLGVDRFSRTVALAGLTTSVFMSPGFAIRGLGRKHEVPDGWTLMRRAPADHQIHLQIGVVQGHFGAVIDALNEVSDPSHHRYGQYLSADQVNELVRPSQTTLVLVEEWFRENNISNDLIQYSPAMDWITLEISIGTAERLLQAEYHEFWHEESSSFAIRSPTWALPPHLRAHIECIQPTDSFLYARTGQRRYRVRDGGDLDNNLNQAADEFAPGSMASIDLDHLPEKLTVAQACNASAVTPLCIRVLYGTLNYQAKAADKNAMGLVNYDGEFNNRSDIQRFLELYRPEAARTRAAFQFRSEEIGGAVNQQTRLTPGQRRRKSGREGALDAQIMLGVSWPTPLITYTTGGPAPPFQPQKYAPTNTNEPFLTWLHYVLARPDDELPRVIATSYGDIEATVPPAYARRVCEGFAQLGARGVTVIFGAGDWGVGKPDACYADSESNRGTSRKQHGFLVSFPASCPYGTSVGATRGMAPEEVAYNNNNGFVSGGGFSRYFSRPAYQANRGAQGLSPVDAYLSRLGDRYDGLFNRAGRAYPDVAAQGYRRPIVWDAKTYLVDGTSASAPTFAAVVALVNDALLSAGQPPLGFLNPWLYATAHEAFTDVTIGSTKGCNTSGFHAGPGWDPASGFGTPWFPRLKAMALEHRFRRQRPWYWPVAQP